jgi:hypothetical protein
MQLKKKENRLHEAILRSYQFVNSKKIVILLVLFIFLSGSLLGMSISGLLGNDAKPKSIIKQTINKILPVFGLNYDDTAFVRAIILKGDYYIINNYFKGISSTPKHITIDIKNNDFQKLAYKREIALSEGILIKSEDDPVPAKIHYNNQTFDAQLRLKGDWIDHLEGDKWSFRIDLKGDKSLFGMKVFSIQDPKTRNYLNEWFFQRAIEKEGIIALRYFFVDVTINGKDKGIYALEEHFDKRLIENNNLREGPIIRFNEEILWLGRFNKNEDIGEIDYFNITDIDAFQSGKIAEDPEKYELFIKAKDLLGNFRNGSLKTSEVFDTEKLARYIALSNILGGVHGLIWHNSRFYYNPITSKLEPIGFDSDTGEDIKGSSWIELNRLQDPFFQTILKDPIFYEKYITELERMSDKSYLDNLFIELDEDIEKNSTILFKDRPEYYFSKEVYYSNQEQIRKILNPIRGLNAYTSRLTNKTLILEIANLQSLPIEVINLSYGKSQVFLPKEKRNILFGKSASKPLQYEKIEFNLPNGFNSSLMDTSLLKINYKIIGHSKLRNEQIFPWPYISEDSLNNDFIRESTNLNDFDFLLVDNTTKKIVIKSGDWELNKSLIIPGGYSVIWQPLVASRMNLRNNATIVSYSPILFLGDEDSPITITSSDSTGQGITVLNAGGRSILNRVIFSNLSAPSQEGWKLTGPITFYNSNVDIDTVEFSDNKFGDDMLNLIKSEYTITNSLFKNTLFDALDNDFAKGVISNTVFINIGNDAMDFSGSLVNITGVSVNGTGDKGVSAGEKSRISIDQIDLKNCNIAIASKDLSIVVLNNARIYSSNIGLAAYQKKPEFGPAEINAFNIDITNVSMPNLIEVNSKLSIDNEEILGTQKNLYDRLYSK